jgi:hypothetical protein
MHDSIPVGELEIRLVEIGLVFGPASREVLANWFTNRSSMELAQVRPVRIKKKRLGKVSVFSCLEYSRLVVNIRRWEYKFLAVNWLGDAKVALKNVIQ